MEPYLLKEIENWIARFEASPVLLEATNFRDRSDWLDRLDVLLDDSDSGVTAGTGTRQRALEIRAKLEATNDALYHSIRKEVRQGRRPELFSQLLGEESVPAPGLSFDHLDDLLASVLELEEPDPPPAHPPAGMVFYQPTPARHIFHLLRLANLSETDVLVDLGSGLGHVPLLASICTAARCIGIEREETYVLCARRCALQLDLERVMFLQQDARDADLSTGTVFYLYTPFNDAILADVLNSLQQEARTHPIRVCTFGPCAETIACVAWLESSGRPDLNQITVYHSRM